MSVAQFLIKIFEKITTLKEMKGKIKQGQFVNNHFTLLIIFNVSQKETTPIYVGGMK